MTRRLLVLALALLATGAGAQTLTAYPNPHTSGPLTVTADAPDATFELVDVLGRVVDTRGPLAPGAYLWRLRYADGSASVARPLTLATPGPLDVRIVHEAAPGPLVSAPVPHEEAQRGGGCAPQPGGVLFGGAYHAPAPGVVMSGGTTMLVQGASGAGFSTCLPGAYGMSYGFPGGASPFKGTDEELQAVFSGTYGAGTPISGTFLLERDSGVQSGATIRGGVDASSPRIVEVIRYDAEGTPSVVASSVIPAGTPTSSIFARLTTPADFELANTTVTGWSRGPLASLDTLWRVQFDFRTNAPSGLLQFEIQDAVAQGHAVSLTAQIDGLLALDLFSMDGTTMEFEVDALGMATQPDAVAPVATAIPAWLRMLDPNGLYSSDAGTMEIGCGQGQTCASYGVEASPGFGTWGTSIGTSPLVSFPTAGAISGSGFSAASGRGVLLDRLDELRHDAYYTITLENLTPALEQRVASITFGKPRLGKTSLRMEEECADELALTPCTPTFDRFELRYIRNGQVRLSKVLPADRTITFNARLEILSSESLLDSSTPYFRYAIDLNGGEEYIELVPQTDPSATSFVYGKITWTYTDPWSFELASWEEGVAARPASSLADGTASQADWRFEIE